MTKKEILIGLKDGITADIIRNEINVLWYIKKLKKVKGKGKDKEEQRKHLKEMISSFKDSEGVGEFFLKDINRRIKLEK